MLFVSLPLAIAFSHSSATGTSAALARANSPATAFPQSSYPLVTASESSVWMMPPPRSLSSSSLLAQDRDDATSYAFTKASSRCIQGGGSRGARRVRIWMSADAVIWSLPPPRRQSLLLCHSHQCIAGAVLPPLRRPCRRHCCRVTHAVVDAAATPLGGKRRRGSCGELRHHGN
jgi:hypothetical protein